MVSPTSSLGGSSIDAYVQAANPLSFPTVLVFFDEGESVKYASQEFFHHLATEVITDRITPSRPYLTLSNKKVHCIFLDKDISYDTPRIVLVTETEVKEFLMNANRLRGHTWQKDIELEVKNFLMNVDRLRGQTWQIAVDATLHPKESILKEVLNAAFEWKSIVDNQYADECEKKSGNSIKWLIIALCVCLTVMKLKSSWSPKNPSKYKNIKRARRI